MKNVVRQFQTLPDRALFWVGALLIYSGALKVEALDGQTATPTRNHAFKQQRDMVDRDMADKAQKAPPVFSGT